MHLIFSSVKRQYLSYSLYLVRCTQDPTLPDCTAIFENIISSSLKQSNKKLPSNFKQAAETAVYRIALDLFDSSRYRNVFGLPNQTGEQLLHICRKCLDYYLEVKYITQQDYDEHNDYLTECDLQFEKYGLY